MTIAYGLAGFTTVAAPPISFAGNGSAPAFTGKLGQQAFDNTQTSPTEYVYNGVSWVTGGVNPATTTTIGSVYLSTLAQLEGGTAPAGPYVPLANDVYTFATGLVNQGAATATTTVPGIVYLSTTANVVSPYSTLAANTCVAVNTITAMFASPPTIGGTAAGAATFTTVTATGLITGDAGATLNSGGTAINIGTDNNTDAINIGTTGARTITIGNTTALDALVLNFGTGEFVLNGSATSTITVGASLTSGSITIGGTAMTGNLIIGNSSGTNTTEFGIGNGVNTTNISTGTGGNTVSIATGSGGNTFSVGGVGGDTIDIGNAVNTSTQTINIAAGNSGAASNVNILTGTGTSGNCALVMASNLYVNTISIGNVAPHGARTTTICGGNQAQNDTINVLNGAPSANTQTFNLLCGTATGGTQAINIGNGVGGALTIAIGNGTNTTAQTVSISSGAAGSTQTVNLMNVTATTGTQTLNIANAVTSGGTQVVDIFSAAAVSTAQTLNIFNGANTTTTNTMNIAGSGATGTKLTLNMLTGAAAHVLNVGSTSSGNMTFTIASGATFAVIGSGGTINVGNDNAANTINIGNGTSAVSINIGNGTAGNTIDVGNGAVATAQTINIANGASAAASTVNVLCGTGTASTATLNLGNNPRLTALTIANVAPSAARTVTICGGNQAQNDTLNIMAGAPTANTQTVNILTGTGSGGTQVCNIATGSSVASVNIGNSGSGAIVLTTGNSNTITAVYNATTMVTIASTGGKYHGNAANTAPAAGFIGEEIRATVSSGAAVSLTTATPANVTSISLTAGIWNVSGIVQFTGMTTATIQYASVNTTSATVGTQGDNAVSAAWASTTNADVALVIPSYRISLSVTTTVYLVAEATFSVGSGAAYGRINGVRAA